MEDSDGTGVSSTDRAVVCAVDHSAHAHAVAYTAAGMAMMLGARVVLFRSDPRVRGERQAQLSAHGDLEALAHRSIGSPTGGRVKVAIDVAAESPADGIRRHLASTRPVMTLIGSRGRPFLSRSLFGSTALALLQQTHAPLMVVPPTDPEVFTVSPDGVQCHVGAILIPVDLSDATASQVQFANIMLAAERCPVTLLHVAPRGESDRHAGVLEKIKAQLQAGHHPVETMVVEGDVRRVLADLLSGDKFGLVVLGRDRHRSGAVAADLLRVSTALVAVAP